MKKVHQNSKYFVMLFDGHVINMRYYYCVIIIRWKRLISFDAARLTSIPMINFNCHEMIRKSNSR